MTTRVGAADAIRSRTGCNLCLQGSGQFGPHLSHSRLKVNKMLKSCRCGRDGFSSFECRREPKPTSRTAFFAQQGCWANRLLAKFPPLPLFAKVSLSLSPMGKSSNLLVAVFLSISQPHSPRVRPRPPFSPLRGIKSQSHVTAAGRGREGGREGGKERILGIYPLCACHPFPACLPFSPAPAPTS